MPRQTTRDLDGCITEIVLQNYADRILVLVTQLGKVGTLIQAVMPATTPLLPSPAVNPSDPDHAALPLPSPAIELTTLFGSAPSGHMSTLHSLYAAQISTIIWTQESKSSLEVPRRNVIVGLALRPTDGADNSELTTHERVVFQGVMNTLQELLI